jgi:hypothetical protein
MKLVQFLCGTFLLTMLVACQDRTATELATAINNYNTQVIAAYRSGDTRPLRAFASKKEANMVQVLVDIKHASRLILEAELQNFEVQKVQSSAEVGYTIHTRERWKYYDRSLDVGVPPGPTFVVDMFLHYTIRREEGNWKVQQVEAEKSEYLQGAKPSVGKH